jgi:hypothetical protein
MTGLTLMWKNGGNLYLTGFHGAEGSPIGFPPFSHNPLENSFTALSPRSLPEGVFNNPLENSAHVSAIQDNPVLNNGIAEHRFHLDEFSTFPQGLSPLFFFP